jgi:hypothetical protein
MRIIWQDEQGPTMEDGPSFVKEQAPECPSASSNEEPEPDNLMPEEYGEGMGDCEDAG